MCLIIKKPRGRQICADFIENAWRRNSDGWGSFHLVEGELRWAKGMDLESLLAHNRQLPHGAEAFIHLRKATYGEVCPEMAHPYQVREGLFLMHNGSIHHLAPRDPLRSDTAELARLLSDMLAQLSDSQAEAVIRSEGFAHLLEPMIRGSMIVLLDRLGAVCMGREWHRIGASEWHGTMLGIEVSNRLTWRPCCQQTPWWQRLGLRARWRWQLFRSQLRAQLRARSYAGGVVSALLR